MFAKFQENVLISNVLIIHKINQNLYALQTVKRVGMVSVERV